MCHTHILTQRACNPLPLHLQFEGVLNWAFPSWWIPLYKMVAFTSIPYSEAIDRAERQDRALHRAATVVKLGAVGVTVYAAASALGVTAPRISFQRN